MVTLYGVAVGNITDAAYDLPFPEQWGAHSEWDRDRPIQFGPGCRPGEDCDVILDIDSPLDPAHYKIGPRVDATVRRTIAHMAIAYGAAKDAGVRVSARERIAYYAGRRVVEELISTQARARWRKWRLLWTSASFWIKTTGEHQGAVGAPIGDAALAAYAADEAMGEGA